MKVLYKVPPADQPWEYSRQNDGSFESRCGVKLALDFVIEVKPWSTKYSLDSNGYLVEEYNQDHWENSRALSNYSRGTGTHPEEWLATMQKICDALTILSELGGAERLELIMEKNW